MNKEIDYSSLELDGIDHTDYPDFSDAYIAYGLYDDGSELSEDALERLNEDGDLVHELVFKHIF